MDGGGESPCTPWKCGIVHRAGTGSSHHRNSGISTTGLALKIIGQGSFLKFVPWDGDVPILGKGVPCGSLCSCGVTVEDTRDVSPHGGGAGWDSSPWGHSLSQ